MLRKFVGPKSKRLKMDTRRHRSHSTHMGGPSSAIHVRDGSHPQFTNGHSHGTGQYLTAAANINNHLGGHKTWVSEVEHFKALSTTAYVHNAAQEKFIEEYLTEMRQSYMAQEVRSNEELEAKLEKAEEAWLSAHGVCNVSKSVVEVDNVAIVDLKGKDVCREERVEVSTLSAGPDKKELEKVLRKVRNEHIPKVSPSPSPENFRYLENSIRMLVSKQTICFCVDIEAYESNTKVVTEIGISIYDPRENLYSAVPNFRTYHLIVSESMRLRNNKFVCDYKDCFLQGESMVMTLNSCVEFIQSLINYYMLPRTEPDGTWNRAFVGHNVKGDLRWLSSIGVKIPKDLDHEVLALGHKKKRIGVLDTEKLFRLSYGSKGSSLGKILRLLEIPHAYLHNAGNDAYFTLKLLMHFCDISFRKRLGMDDLYGMAHKIEMWGERDHHEPKILPMSYTLATKEFTNPSLRRKIVSQTEFGGCRFFMDPFQAFKFRGT